MAQRLLEDDDGIDVVHAPHDFFGDLYHTFLRAPWWVTLLAIASSAIGRRRWGAAGR